ncbi:MAG: hypothetical protein ACJ8ET_06435 [Sphingomicrobium sp.]
MTGGEASEAREALVRQALFVFIAVLLPFGVAFAPNIFNDGDVSWHVATGQWIAAHREIPTTDPFSLTAAGQPWVAMEWPADLMFAGAYALAGLAGLATLFAAALMALHVVIFVHLQRRTSPLLVVGALLLMDLALSPFMLVRPHALVWPLLALWTVLLARTAETGRPPPLWAALLLTLWANLHGSFPIAAIVGGCLALDALIAAQWKTLREWLVFGGVCLVAVCLNANGLAGILNPFHIARLKSLNLIAEWLPSTPSFTPQFYAVLLLVLGLMLWRGVRIPVGRLALLLGLLALAFTQVRHQSWFAIVAAVVLPPLFAGKPQPLGRVAPLALAAAPLLLIRALWPLTPPETDANPTHLLAAIPPDLRTQAVFNEYTFGGPLILAGIRPYIDGRSELYGDAFMTDYVEIAKGDMARFDRAVARYGIRWAVLPTADKSKLRDELARSPRWRRIYADKVGVIFVRKD